MKKQFIIAFAFIITLLSCSSDENQTKNEGISTLSIEKTLKINTETGNVNSSNKGSFKTKSLTSSTDFYQEVKMNFICDPKMGTFQNEEELENFLINYPKKTNGICELYIDNQMVYKVEVIDGTKNGGIILLTPPRKDDENLGDYPCTYHGIKACAIDRIHAQNWYDMALCIAEGLGCVGHHYISCAVDNCPEDND